MFTPPAPCDHWLTLSGLPPHTKCITCHIYIYSDECDPIKERYLAIGRAQAAEHIEAKLRHALLETEPTQHLTTTQQTALETVREILNDILTGHSTLTDPDTLTYLTNAITDTPA